MTIIDISVPIRERMPTWPGDPVVRLDQPIAIAKGDPANVGRIDAGLHTGTHVDGPRHFLEGAGGVETLALDAFFGPAEVVDLTAAEALDEAAIRGGVLPLPAERVLLKTRNSRLWALDEYSDDNIRLDGPAAQALVDAGARLVGIDYLSIGDGDAHRTLLSAGVACVEGLDLRDVAPGRYTFACFPLRIVGADGGPTRAVLMPT